jgi:hypothetical protein
MLECFLNYPAVNEEHPFALDLTNQKPGAEECPIVLTIPLM